MLLLVLVLVKHRFMKVDNVDSVDESSLGDLDNGVLTQAGADAAITNMQCH